MDHAIELWGQPLLTFSLRHFAPCCEFSLLPPCADRFAYRSERVVCLCKQQLSLICVLAYILGPVALGYFDELESPSPPINGVAWCWDSSSIACAISITNAWRYILVPPQQKFQQKIPTHWKMVSYPHVLYYLCHFQ